MVRKISAPCCICACLKAISVSVKSLLQRFAPHCFSFLAFKTFSSTAPKGMSGCYLVEGKLLAGCPKRVGYFR